MEKRRILIDGAIFGLQKSGGISRLFMEMLQGLDEKKIYEIIILLPKNSNIEWQTNAENLKNVSIIKRKKFKKRFFLDSLYLTLIAAWVRPHLWHSSYYTGMPWFFCKKKYITFHDMMGEIFNLTTPLETKLKHNCLKKSDRILAISEHSKKDLDKFWPHFSKKTSVLHNGLSHKHEEKVICQKPFFLFLGKRRYYKNFLFCAQSILNDERFNQYTLKVIGGENDLNSEEKGLKRVEWLGVLAFEEIKKYLTSTSALLFPSLYEGFGFPVLEAFQHETIALAYQTSSIPEITGSDYPLVDPNRPEMLCDVLDRLLKEREYWSAYGKRRASLFSRDIFIDKLIKDYEI